MPTYLSFLISHNHYIIEQVQQAKRQTFSLKLTEIGMQRAYEHQHHIHEVVIGFP
jgi:hypothetical protein